MGKGFTLIELVIVIIILGVLAAVAVPKFVSLSSDARSEVLTQISTSVKIANDFMYIKSQLSSYSTQAVNNRPDLIDVDTNGDGNFDTRLKWGYLDNTDIEKRIDLSDEFETDEEGISHTYIGYDLNDDTLVKDDNCYFKYTQASSDTNPPVYLVVDSGC